MRKLLIIGLILFSIKTYSQTTGYQPKSVIRIISENDFWLFKQRTDIFYTQGLKVEFLKHLEDDSEFIKFWPFFLKNKTQNIIGYGLGQNLYTSGDITVHSIMKNDRPYSAWLYVSSSFISNNEKLNKRLTSDIYLGVIGPIALGEEAQSNWHELINSPDPKGWKNQIENDIGVNLNLKYEKGLISHPSKDLSFDFVPHIEIQAGSVFNIAAVGTTTRLSIWNSSTYFQNALGEGDIPKLLKAGEVSLVKRPDFWKSFSSSNFSIYASNSGNLVFWNSMLQGGIFSQDSRHLINNDSINRFYFDLEYGITYSNPYFNIAYSRAFRTKELNQQGENHKWGKFQVVLKL